MTDPSVRPLQIFAAGSLMGVSADLAGGFAAAFPGNPHPEFTFGMTGDVADRILTGEPADVLISADRGYAEAVHRAGRLGEPRSLAGNWLAIVRSKASAATIEGLADLAKPGVRLAILPPNRDPGGAYADALFRREGLAGTIAAKLASGEGVMAGHQRSPRGSLADGSIDAMVIYATVASSLADICEIVPLPPELDMHDTIEFTIGLVGSDPRPPAVSFLEWMLGPVGQACLRGHGFLPPAADRK